MKARLLPRQRISMFMAIMSGSITHVPPARSMNVPTLSGKGPDTTDNHIIIGDHMSTWTIGGEGTSQVTLESTMSGGGR